MPAGARILPFPPSPRDPHGGTIEIWAQVDPEHPMKTRHFRIFGTGHPMPDDDAYATLTFIGTVITHDGTFVWHIFEVLT